MTASAEMTKETRGKSFDEKTEEYSGDDLKELLKELAERTNQDEKTIECPISPEEMNVLLGVEDKG